VPSRALFRVLSSSLPHCCADEEPLHVSGEVHLPNIGGQPKSTSDARVPLLRKGSHDGREQASRGCSATLVETMCGCFEPRLVVSRTPHGHRTGPARRRNTSYVRSVGRSDPHVRLCSTPCGVLTASVTRPAKSEILVGIEVSSVRPNVRSVRGSLPRSHNSPVSFGTPSNESTTCSWRTDAFFTQRSFRSLRRNGG
jgi:hypothetical protein